MKGPLRDQFWRLFSSFMLEIAFLARETTNRLTGRRARTNERVDLEFCRDYLDRMQLCESAIPELEARLTAAVGAPHQSKDPFGEMVWGFVRIVCIARTGLVQLLLRVLRQRVSAIDDEGDVHDLAQEYGLEEWDKIPGPSLGDFEYYSRLNALYFEAKTQSFRATRELIKIIRVRMETGSPLSLMSGSQFVFPRLPLWMNLHVTQATEEEGGPEGFTFEVKLSEMKV